VFGSGNYLGLEVNTSKSSRTLVLSTVDPYFTIDGISRSFDVYYRTTKPINSQGEQYELITPGAAIRFGVPFPEYDTVFFGIGAERTRIKGGNSMPGNLYMYRLTFGESSQSFPFTIGWTRDERDSALVPNDGSYKRVNVDLSFLGDVKYMRTNLQYQHYWPITRQFTFAVNTELGYGKSLNDRPYPVFKNFYGGGLGTVRAFDQGSLGPPDTLGAYVGGNVRFNVNTELYVPVPGAGNDRTLRVFGYVDAGNVWDTEKTSYERISFDTLRASAGIGLSWISPVGPLKLSYGTPIRYKSQDKIQRLQFQIGTAF
jgi:outer membrane protein insertion porin family